ncbi:Conserved_hypothetical protein [Hexamita inflata]|uniref:Uncharacterized protein n=1 Tax=Hexamita inflata TaxID=28002 RepID=A0AA86U6Q0_9EUKA|nr:Conserved hypothetical protein [Hexamita inflata]
MCALKIEVTNCECSGLFTKTSVSGKPGIFICSCNSPYYLSAEQDQCGSNCPMNQFYSTKNQICKICGTTDEGIDSLVCTICQIYPLMQTFGAACVCGPGTTGGLSNCQCLPNYLPESGKCSCSKLDVDGIKCLSQCQSIHVLIGTQCTVCGSNLIPNVGQTKCVDKSCEGSYLSTLGIYCISSCFIEQAVSNAQNQCKPCSFFDPLSSWKATDCQCVRFTSHSYPSCACLPNFDNQGNECVCRSGRFTSSDETDCLDQCPPENIVSGNRCSECEDHLVPNVAKSSCVDRKCEGAVLNPDWSFCVAECQSGLAADSSNQCKLCADINQYAVWDDKIQSCTCGEQTVGDYRECKFCWQVSFASDYSSDSKSCRCGPETSGVFPNCRCLDNFEEILGGCRCALKLTADGRCVYKCPSGQVSPSGAGLCRQCADNKIANYDQTACVQRNGCAPYLLSIEQNQCVFGCGTNAEMVNNVCQCVGGFFLVEDTCQQPSQVTTCSQSIITLAGTLTFCSRSEIASNARISRNVAVSTNSKQFSFFRMLTRVKNSDINLNIWFGQAPVSLSFATDALISSSQISIVTGGSAGYLVSYYGFAQLLDCDLTFTHIGSRAGLILKGKTAIQNSVLYFKASHFVFEDVAVKSSKLIGNGAGFEGGIEILNSCASFVIDCAGCKLENLTQC